MAIYAAMIDRMDENIGRVLRSVRDAGETDRTLVIFTSDNGGCAEWDPHGFDGESGPNNVLHTGEELEQMGSGGTYHSVGSGWANASNTPWRMFKHFTHEGGIAVPLVITAPTTTSAGMVTAQPSHLVDLLPTILDATGVGADDELPGQSLLPLLTGESIAPQPLFFEHEGNRGIRDGRWKLVSLRDQPWEVYGIDTDRSEQTNLAASQPERVAELAAAWDEWAERNNVTPLPSDYGVEYLPAALGQ